MSREGRDRCYKKISLRTITASIACCMPRILHASSAVVAAVAFAAAVVWFPSIALPRAYRDHFSFQLASRWRCLHGFIPGGLTSLMVLVEIPLVVLLRAFKVCHTPRHRRTSDQQRSQCGGNVTFSLYCGVTVQISREKPSIMRESRTWRRTRVVPRRRLCNVILEVMALVFIGPNHLPARGQRGFHVSDVYTKAFRFGRNYLIYLFWSPETLATC